VARWTVGDAIEALESRDKDAREDIGRTCPLFVTATYSELLRAVDMMTARQVEARLRQILDDAEVEEPVAMRCEKVVNAGMRSMLTSMGSIPEIPMPNAMGTPNASRIMKLNTRIKTSKNSIMSCYFRYAFTILYILSISK